jgi:hypothetical protein
VYRDKYAPDPLGYLYCENVELFISALKSWHDRSVIGKESNFLISPAIFDPNHPNRDGNQQRGLSNIAYLQHIWLDFENGELQPDEIAKLFPLNRLVVFNSYNHRTDKPRFRVVFLTNRQLTPEAYELLWDNIATKLEDAGYWVGKEKQRAGINLRPSGLDDSKRTPASLFFAPIQAKNQNHSFFVDNHEPNRHLLDPSVWIENNIVPFPVPFIAKDRSLNIQRTVNQEKVDRATEEWRIANHREGDNYRFYRYAKKLQRAGISLPEIERKLQSEVQSANDPAKRRTKIKSIIASLKKPPQKITDFTASVLGEISKSRGYGS